LAKFRKDADQEPSDNTQKADLKTTRSGSCWQRPSNGSSHSGSWSPKTRLRIRTRLDRSDRLSFGNSRHKSNRNSNSNRNRIAVASQCPSAMSLHKLVERVRTLSSRISPALMTLSPKK